MITIFDLLPRFGIVCGFLLGTFSGHVLLGIPGAVAGGLIGGILGYLLGKIPFIITTRWLFGRLEQSPTHDLKQRLDHDWVITHFIIAQLIKRGEPVAQFRDRAVSLLRSDRADQRNIGWTSARLYYPDLERDLAGYQPFSSTETCRKPTDRLSPTTARE